MKKALLWVRVLSAVAAVGVVGALILLGVLLSTPVTSEFWRTTALLTRSYGLLPPVLLLIWALICRSKGPCRPLLAAAALTAAVPCGLFFCDWFQRRIIQDGGGVVREWQWGWLAFEEWPRYSLTEPKWFMEAVRWWIGLAALIGVLFFLWVAADVLLRHRGSAVSRGLVSLYALLRAGQCAFLIWEFTVTITALTDPDVWSISRPFPLMPYFEVCCILAGTCLTAAWTVLIWGGVKRSERV